MAVSSLVLSSPQCPPSCREPTSANVAKLVIRMQAPACVKTVAGAVRIQQNEGLKNGCLALRVTDVSSPIPVISTILLQTPVTWCTAVMTVGRLFTRTVNILATKHTARYASKINPTFTNATSSHNHQRSRVMDKCIFSMTLNVGWMRKRNTFPTCV